MQPSTARDATPQPLRRRSALRRIWGGWLGASLLLIGAVALFPGVTAVAPGPTDGKRPVAERAAPGETPGRAGALRYNVVAGTGTAGNVAAASRPARPSRPEQPRTIAEFDKRQTRALIESGWSHRAAGTDGFRHHAQRVATLAALAREQGYEPSVGAMQAHFGTLAESARRSAPALWNELTVLRRRMLALRKAGAAPSRLALIETRVAELEKALEPRLRVVSNGSSGRPSGWETINLDVNADGVVNGEDLAEAREIGE